MQENTDLAQALANWSPPGTPYSYNPRVVLLGAIKRNNVWTDFASHEQLNFTSWATNRQGYFNNITFIDST